MLYRKTQLCLRSVPRQNNTFNGNFIQKVREEDNRDKILEDVFMRSTEENPYHKLIQENIAICNAIKEEQTKNFISAKRVQQRHQTNAELLRLGRQLRDAYVSKTIYAQNFERKALKEEERATAHFQNLVLEEATIKQDEHNKKIVEENQKKKAILRHDLQDQIASTRAKREEEKIQVKEDKRMMDEAVRKYREDEERKARAALEKKMKNKADMIAFIRKNNEFRTTQAKSSNEELEEDRKYLAQCELKKHELVQKRKEKQDQRYQISQKIGSKLHVKAEQKRNFEEFLMDLLINESKAKDDFRDQQNLERRISLRSDLRRDLENYQKNKYRHKLESKKQMEEECRRELLHLEQIKKHDKLMDEKRRQKALEYQKGLANSLDERRIINAKEIKRAVMENESLNDNNLRREKLNELEYMRILNEHAPVLEGFLPKNLRDQLSKK